MLIFVRLFFIPYKFQKLSVNNEFFCLNVVQKLHKPEVHSHTNRPGEVAGWPMIGGNTRPEQRTKTP